MSRTRKWSMVAQEATRLAAIGASPLEIAEKIGVNKSTVTRWFAAGKLTRATGDQKPESFAPVLPRQSPAEWAKSMREEFALSASDEQLVTLGEQALSLTRDVTVSASVQLAAQRNFLAIDKALALRTRAAKAEEQTPVPTPAPVESKKNPPIERKPAGDPRTLYMVPKAVGE